MQVDYEGDDAIVDDRTENVLSRLYKKYFHNVFLNVAGSDKGAISSHGTSNSEVALERPYSVDQSKLCIDGSSFSGVNPIVLKNNDRSSVIEL